jgi:hypothetical protein
VQNISFCALASVVDAIMVLLLYFVLSLIYKDSLWIHKLTIMRILIIVWIGGFGAILFESMHIMVGSWIYTDPMPIIPFTNVSLSPSLQFLILPGLVYFLLGIF